MSNIAIVTLPNSDQTTRYISAWAELTLESLKSNKLKFIPLVKGKATQSIFQSMCEKHKPSLVFLNGHGGPDAVCGQNNEVLLKAGENDVVLAGSVVYALSCSSAKLLGPSAVSNGTRAYIGYTEDFIFFISPDKRTKPREDKTAEKFLAPANHVIISLAKGHTTLEATGAAKSYFLKSIQGFASSKSSGEEREYIRYLVWNMRNLTCVGDTKTTVV